MESIICNQTTLNGTELKGNAVGIICQNCKETSFIKNFPVPIEVFIKWMANFHDLHTSKGCNNAPAKQVVEITEPTINPTIGIPIFAPKYPREQLCDWIIRVKRAIDTKSIKKTPDISRLIIGLRAFCSTHPSRIAVNAVTKQNFLLTRNLGVKSWALFCKLTGK